MVTAVAAAGAKVTTGTQLARVASRPLVAVHTDAVLYRDDLPPVFMLLSEEEQLRAGNAFMRHLSTQMNPQNPALGQREVIRLIDAGERLSAYFDLDLAALLPVARQTSALPLERRPLEGYEA